MLTLRTAALAAAIAALAACSSDKGDKDSEASAKKTDAAPRAAVATTDAAPTVSVPPSKDAASGDPATPTDAGAATVQATVDAAPKATVKDPPANKKLENIKVLPKSWNYAKVEQYMKKTVERGLGQKCEFCHDEDDFASDDNKKKQEARDMIKMTTALDRKYFKGQGKLTCYTCHRGNKELE